ncbi:MAG: hypothetical protein Q4C98_08150 [Capnocytophaga sp.]|nr:hypothetical protein [Capnocytophaga sp.]
MIFYKKNISVRLSVVEALSLQGFDEQLRGFDFAQTDNQNIILFITQPKYIM